MGRSTHSKERAERCGTTNEVGNLSVANLACSLRVVILTLVQSGHVPSGRPCSYTRSGYSD